MEVMAREMWTDQRLDDLNERIASIDRRMEAGFGGISLEFRAVRAEMQSEFQAVRAESQALRAEMREEFQAVRLEMKTEFAAVRAEMAAQAEMLNRTMYRLFGGMLVAWVVGVIAIIAQT